MIKLHNELMSVQQKLLECEKALNSPVDCENHLDSKINHMLKLIIDGSNNGGDLSKAALLLTPTVSSNLNTSGGSQSSSLNKNNSNKEFNSQVSSIDSKTSDANNNQLCNIVSIINSVKGFKNHAIEIEKGKFVFLIILCNRCVF